MDRTINVNFIKQSPAVDEIMETDSERVETTQEEIDDKMRTDTSYSPDEGSDLQSTVISLTVLQERGSHRTQKKNGNHFKKSRWSVGVVKMLSRA